MHRKMRQVFISAILLLSLASPATFATTVRMQTSLGDIDIQLMDAAAPATVSNFLNYVTSAAYVNSFIHRSLPEFIIQGGGFRWNNATNAYSAIPANAPVINEFSASRSNLRGTIAMAKLGGDPNSATNQWFFNLADNSENLDGQNGGFTVFGQVIGNGMQVVDAIAQLPRIDADGATGATFDNLPLATPVTAGFTAQNLVIISAVTVLDTQAPVVPVGLTATATSSSQVTLAWTAATDNVAVTAYKVYRDGALAATLANVTNYTDGGLAASASYSYTVAACDAADNCSAQSAAAAAATLPPCVGCFVPNLESGFNLIGNSLNTTLIVATMFGNLDSPVAGISSNVLSVWKWNAVDGRWAFYSPLLSTAGNVSYAASKNYELLATINAGEGYWVNAAGPMALPAQGGSNFSWSGSSFTALPSGFNLIANAGSATPSQFNSAVSVTPPGTGVVATDNFASLWAWDAVQVKWYFYSPLLESSGGLPAVKAYADSHSFLHFQDYNKLIDTGVGIWVNKF
ncbi:MAG: hypothetical protein A3H35_03145 [Betaproteobacteria bacterium RIFCSPLOWO2_02_FULL_62_17]|nr:MAG: hypothetical protein A3H35_03145 [Betaproteobacteria bacterium RIFCSPLOWO2_02_FULL_62_17]